VRHGHHDEHEALPVTNGHFKITAQPTGLLPAFFKIPQPFK